MSEKKQEYRVGIGASSMLMIFIVLCLTTLGVLALTGARTDRAMTERNIRIVKDYYEAVSEVQVIISRIDEMLLDLKSAADEAEYDRAFDDLWLEDVLYFSADAEDKLIRFSVDAGNDSTVDVVLKAAGFGEAGPRYGILSHTLTYIDNWEAEFDLQLFTEETANTTELMDLD